MNAKYALKSQYWGEAEWLFHQDVLKVINKIKGGDGQYIWRESVVAGEPDTLLGLPVNVSQYSPNTLTTGQYVGILGAMRFYVIADGITYGLKRLNELYAETNQVGFIVRKSCDAMPALEEAFVRVKLG